jgi:hypothetical protein
LPNARFQVAIINTQLCVSCNLLQSYSDGYRAENDQIINSAEADAAVDSTYVVVSIIFIFLFGLGLCALEASFINYDLTITPTLQVKWSVPKVLDLVCPFLLK